MTDSTDITDMTEEFKKQAFARLKNLQWLTRCGCNCGLARR